MGKGQENEEKKKSGTHIWPSAMCHSSIHILA
jgi:hypothetical protein